MMRTLLLVSVLVAGLVLAAVPAQAQQQANLVLTLGVPEEPLREGEKLRTGGTATFSGDTTAYLNLNGIPVEYVVTKKPEWATVFISPKQDVFPLSASSPTYTSQRPFEVTVLADPDMAQDAVGEIEITAVTRPGALANSASGMVSIPILFDDGKEAPCTAESHAEATPEDHLSIQSAATAGPAASWWPAAAAGLVGVGAGLVVGRRRQR